MRRILLALLLVTVALQGMAVPAKRGIWKTLPLNGKMVKAQLVGDEHIHYWQTDSGLQLVEEDGTFALAETEKMMARAMSRRAKAASHRQRRVRQNAIGDFMSYKGKKKGLIILVEFSNMQFLPANDSLLYTRICNEEGFSEGRFRGSVYDYFKAQSYNEFELTFDVVGPVQMDTTYQYYGKDVGGNGDDAHAGLMVAKACMAVADKVDFRDYDWDGDGFVDQVMCIYAGLGQADGGASNTIWPHEWELAESDFGEMLLLDSVFVNTYACANERQGNIIEGIGTICHEFSHCLGLPDMYDINYKGNYGMSSWSLMDSGSYNGDGFCPSGYSSFDKYTCGWVKPKELSRDVQVDSMLPLCDSPEVYMVRNDAYDDEYYMLENRQQKGWDAEIPGNGLLILHVDYDRTIWQYNLVNTNSVGGGDLPANDHQRCTIFRAGGNAWRGSHDAYPYQQNDSLTNTSSPAATVFNRNIDGGNLLNKGILDIARNGDGTMRFRFRHAPEDIFVPDNLLFETFNNCNGKGANDGIWTNTMASSNFVPDCKGWNVVKAYGGYKCARFGNGSTAGKGTTPALETETGTAELSFRAAGWDQDGTTLTLSVEGDGTVEPGEVTMENFKWNDYTVKLKGKGKLRVTFAPEKRFLLDDVMVITTKEEQTDGIDTLPTTARQHQATGYYTLDGRYAGSRLEALPRGMYIYMTNNNQKGRKIAK